MGLFLEIASNSRDKRAATPKEGEESQRGRERENDRPQEGGERSCSPLLLGRAFFPPLSPPSRVGWCSLGLLSFAWSSRSLLSKRNGNEMI